MSESSQKFISRNRPPRVQIEYDVETYGAEKKVQLPFVMGVLADLSGDPAEPLADVADRVCRCSLTLKEQLRRRLSVSDAVVADVSSDAARGDDEKLGSDWTYDDVDQTMSQLSRVRVESREDAAQVIDAATRYFEQHEPSSPIPLLLRRAKRLINQDFVDILRDLAPDALVQAKNLAGESED